MKRIFLVGLPRSGTTLLQSMLYAGGEVYSMPETHLLRLGLGRTRIKAQIRAAHFRFAYGENFIESVKCLISKKRFLDCVISNLDLDAHEKNYTVWLEKTPEHLYYSDMIIHNILDCKIIFMERNHVDIAASLIDMWQQVNNDNFFISRTLQYISNARFGLPYILNKKYYKLFFRNPWVFRAVNEIRQGIQYFEDNSDIFVKVNYEELLNDAENVLIKLCNDLGINYSTEMLEYQKVAAKVIEPHESWKNNNSKKINDSRISKFSSLSSLEQDFITSFFKAKLL